MPTQPLSSKERAKLRPRANRLQPVERVGDGGITPVVLEKIRNAFDKNELIKIRVIEGAPDSTHDTAGQIVDAIESSQLVQTIGKTIVLFRPMPEDDVDD